MLRLIAEVMQFNRLQKVSETAMNDSNYDSFHHALPTAVAAQVLTDYLRPAETKPH